MTKEKTNISSCIYAFKYIVLSFLIFISGFILLKFPEATGQGISNGIDLCLGTLIPSLLPFMVVSSIIVNLDVLKLTEKIFSKITYPLLRLPGKSIGIFFLSILGGYPIGGQIIKELYDKNEITASEGRRLLLFCINPSPAFVISSVGFYMLGSKNAGIIVYLSVIISSFIISLFSRLIDSDRAHIKNMSPKKQIHFSDEFIKSVSTAGKAILTVCAWVIIFSGIGNVIEITSFSPGVKLFLCSLLEVTNGCYLASGALNIPTIACIVGFGGLCTHFQIMNTVRAVRLPYKLFFVARIIHAALSAVICNFMLQLYPVSYDVFSLGTLPTKKISSASVALSVTMLLMCALIMLGSSFKIKIKSKKSQIKNMVYSEHI